MNDLWRKNKIRLSAALLLCITICGCGVKKEEADSAPVDQFSGMTVGVMLAWDSDYALTPRKDLNLMRYDELPDMVMALKHNKIDAIAIDDMTARTIEQMVQGIEVIRPGIGRFGYCAGFNERNNDLLEDFNDFLSDFVQTQEYADLQRRMEEFDGLDFEESGIKPQGTGRLIRVAYSDDCFPSAYWDTNSDSLAGFDVEPLIRWANDRNYTLEITGTTFDDMLMGLTRGRYDVAIGCVSELYDGDMNSIGNKCSLPVNYLTNYFIIKSDGEMSAGSDFFDSF